MHLKQIMKLYVQLSIINFMIIDYYLLCIMHAMRSRTSALDLSVLRFGRTRTSLKSSLMSESRRGMAARTMQGDSRIPGKGRQHMVELGALYLEYAIWRT